LSRSCVLDMRMASERRQILQRAAKKNRKSVARSSKKQKPCGASQLLLFCLGLGIFLCLVQQDRAG